MGATLNTVQELRGPLGYVRKLAILAKASPHERQISHVQLATATLPVVLGFLGLPTLLCSNYLRDPNAPEINNPTLKSLVTLAGKSFQVIFELLTLNQIAINVQLAAAGRLITYGLLALANPYFARFEWQSIDQTEQLRKINAAIKAINRELDILYQSNPNSPKIEALEAKLETLKSEQKTLVDKLEDNKSKINFFVRVLMNFIMAFSFASFGPHISSSTQFGRLYPEPGKKYKETMGPYKGQLTQGYTWKDFWLGYKGRNDVETTPPYLTLLKENAKKEWNCFWKGMDEFLRNISDPAKSQKTFTGGNAHVEENVLEANKNVNNRIVRAFNRWRIRASEGLTPLMLNNANIIFRLSLFASAAGALLQGGMKVFNQKPVFNDPAIYDPNIYDNDDDKKELNWLGKACLNVTDSGVWWARMLSAVSGILIAFNPAYLKASGYPSMITYAIGAGLSGASALTGGIPSLKLLNLSLQLASTSVLGVSVGLSNLEKQLVKPAAIKAIEVGLGLEKRRLVHA